MAYIALQTCDLGGSICDAPFSGVPFTTRQPAKTCEYRVLKHHTHMSHISRPISVYFSYKQPFSYNSLQEFDVQLFYTFTCQNIFKLDCSNIFYKNASQGHMSHPISRSDPIGGSEPSSGV